MAFIKWTNRQLLLLLMFWGWLLTGCVSSHRSSLNNDRQINKSAAKTKYTVQNAHSHNDYAQKHFFKQAYEAGFGSMEADIYLVGDQLLVAHNKKDILKARNLTAMYLAPLAELVGINKGYPYKDHQKQLELLIDLKDPKNSPAYNNAVQRIRAFSRLYTSKNLRFTFTGNIPDDSVMAKAQGPIYFDGVPGRNYSPAALKRIYMLSDNFANYSSWDGTGSIKAADYQKLLRTIEAAHKARKKIRFWNAPDNPAAWLLMEKLGVDYINTDRIQQLSDYLQ